MTTTRSLIKNEKGLALVYTAVGLTTMLLFSGLAVDAGRAYVVKAQLSKAVDGAALGAARMLNSGNPRTEASRIFEQNFPSGYMGTTAVTDPDTTPSFYDLATDAANARNIVTVRASATLPTTFMRLGYFSEVTAESQAEAIRRMVDLSLVLDVSSSIGGKWPAVRDASRAFVDGFSGTHDRLSLTTFGNGAQVLSAMPSSRGFDKPGLKAAIANNLPGGSTNMVEGLYRGWDELRSVPAGQQSTLRVIVLFTDGASNGVPGMYDASGVSKSFRTYDFPKNLPDPDNQTHNNPTMQGLYHTQSGSASPSYSLTVPIWSSTQTIPQVPLLPVTSFHSFHRSAGIPTSFPLQTNQLNVDGVAQSTKRGLRNPNGAGRFPADVWNTNNAARNLLEIIADRARSDAGDYPIRVYTIGMGELVRYNLGTIPEKPEDILKRVANDKTSLDHNGNQPSGKYYFAAGADDVSAAFQALQHEIIRLTK